MPILRDEKGRFAESDATASATRPLRPAAKAFVEKHAKPEAGRPGATLRAAAAGAKAADKMFAKYLKGK